LDHDGKIEIKVGFRLEMFEILCSHAFRQLDFPFPSYVVKYDGIAFFDPADWTSVRPGKDKGQQRFVFLSSLIGLPYNLRQLAIIFIIHQVLLI
jgi:hypothetical protein